MTQLEDLAIVMVMVIVLEGVWLAGLTYFMWRRHLRAEKQKEPPSQSGQS